MRNTNDFSFIHTEKSKLNLFYGDKEKPTKWDNTIIQQQEKEWKRILIASKKKTKIDYKT